MWTRKGDKTLKKQKQPEVRDEFQEKFDLRIIENRYNQFRKKKVNLFYLVLVKLFKFLLFFN